MNFENERDYYFNVIVKDRTLRKRWLLGEFSRTIPLAVFQVPGQIYQPRA